MQEATSERDERRNVSAKRACTRQKAEARLHFNPFH